MTPVTENDAGGVILIDEPISIERLREIASHHFGDMVKGVIDVELRVLSVGGELHSDEEAFLLERGSEQKNLWGINIYLDRDSSERIEFDSLINIRPNQSNRSRGVEDPAVRELTIQIVNSLIK